MRTVAAVGFALACVAAAAAEAPATVTLLEGEASLLRATARYALAEGVRLQTGDIVELGEKGIAEIEFGDGSIVGLGPGARFYAGALATGGGVSDLYLMRGWTKFASRKSAAPFRYTTPAFGLWTADAVGVMRVADGESNLFVEAGEVRIAEGFARASSTSPLGVRGGEFVVRKSDEEAITHPRPTASFVAAMPKPFMENLPSRISKYREREVNPERTGDLTYAEVEMWLKAPSEIRRPIMQRFIPQAKDPAFRQALIANLKFHPEWDPILFPEKYKPKPPPAPTAANPPVATPPRPEPAQATPAPVPPPAASRPAASTSVPPPAAPAPPAAEPVPRPAVPAATKPAPVPSPQASPPAAAAPAPAEPVTVEDAGPARPRRSP